MLLERCRLRTNVLSGVMTLSGNNLTIQVIYLCGVPRTLHRRDSGNSTRIFRMIRDLGLYSHRIISSQFQQEIVRFIYWCNSVVE